MSPSLPGDASGNGQDQPRPAAVPADAEALPPAPRAPGTHEAPPAPETADPHATRAPDADPYATRPPEDPYPTRGSLLLRAGRLPEAIADLQRASAQRQPGAAPMADLLLAIAQQKEGQTAAARRTLERAGFLLDGEAPVQKAAGLLGGGGTAGPWSATAAAGQALQPPPRWDLSIRLDVRVLRREAEAALGERRP